MICALLLGREGSVGFPGKNVFPVLGRKIMEYPLLAAMHSKEIDRVFVSTDSQKIKEVAEKHGARIIDRPKELCTTEALAEDAYIHGYRYIVEELKKENHELELLVMLFCNAPCFLPHQVEEAVRVLREHPEYDSAVTASKYNMYSPVRARKIGEDGLLYPFIPFASYPEDMTINCDRDAQGDAYFADVCLTVVRPRCLENLEEGVLPQKWMGQKIYPIRQWGGLDIDFEWQLPQIEYWLEKHGYTESRLPYGSGGDGD